MPQLVCENRNRRTVTKIVRQLEHTLDIAPREAWAPLVHWRGTQDYPIHRWFRYREGFSPQLISELGLQGIILDPFCGAGSILVGAAQAEQAAIGIDINPLATFVARVKLSPLDRRQLREASAFCRKFVSLYRGSEHWPLPGFGLAEKVFEPDILSTLLRLRSAIDGFSADPSVEMFLRLAWLAILEEVGSYYKEGNGIKYRNRKRLKSGYVRRPEGEWQRERFGKDQEAFVLNRLERQLRMMLADIHVWQKGNWQEQRVLPGDAIQIMPRLAPSSVDAIIFSPPYANRFDYFESMKVELWFGGFVDSGDDMLELRQSSLRSHLGAQLSRPADPIPTVESLVALMDRDSYAWRMRVPALIRGYFHDMQQVLRATKRLLRPGGKCHIIVGNSAYGGIIVPTDALVAQLGIACGFSSVKVAPVRHLTVAPQQRTALCGLENYMRESVVTLW